MLKATAEPQGVAAEVERIINMDEKVELGQRNVNKRKLSRVEYE